MNRFEARVQMMALFKDAFVLRLQSLIEASKNAESIDALMDIFSVTKAEVFGQMVRDIRLVLIGTCGEGGSSGGGWSDPIAGESMTSPASLAASHTALAGSVHPTPAAYKQYAAQMQARRLMLNDVVSFLLSFAGRSDTSLTKSSEGAPVAAPDARDAQTIKRDALLNDLVIVHALLVALTEGERWWDHDCLPPSSADDAPAAGPLGSPSSDWQADLAAPGTERDVPPVTKLSLNVLRSLEDFISKAVFEKGQDVKISQPCQRYFENIAIEVFSLVSVTGGRYPAEQGLDLVKYPKGLQKVLRDMVDVKNYNVLTRYVHLLMSIAVVTEDMLEELCFIGALLTELSGSKREVKKLTADFIVRVFGPLCHNGFSQPENSKLSVFAQTAFRSYALSWLEKAKYQHLAAPMATVLLCLAPRAFFAREFLPFFQFLLRSAGDPERKCRASFAMALTHLVGFYLNWATGPVRDPTMVAVDFRTPSLKAPDTIEIVDPTTRSAVACASSLSASIQSLRDLLITQSRRSPIVRQSMPAYAALADLLVMICRTKPPDGVGLLTDMLPTEPSHVLTESTLVALIALTALTELVMDPRQPDSVVKTTGGPVVMPFWGVGAPPGSGSMAVSEEYPQIYSPFSSFRHVSLLSALLGAPTAECCIDTLRLSTTRSLSRAHVTKLLQARRDDIAKSVNLVLGVTEKECAASQHIRSSKLAQSTSVIYLASLADRERATQLLLHYSIIAARQWAPSGHLFHVIPKCLLHLNSEVAATAAQVSARVVLHSLEHEYIGALLTHILSLALSNYEDFDFTVGLLAHVSQVLQMACTQIVTLSEALRVMECPSDTPNPCRDRISDLYKAFFEPVSLHGSLSAATRHGARIFPHQPSGSTGTSDSSLLSLLTIGRLTATLADVVECTALLFLGHASHQIRLCCLSVLHSVQIIYDAARAVCETTSTPTTSSGGHDHPRRCVASVLRLLSPMIEEEVTAFAARRAALGCSWTEDPKIMRKVGSCAYYPEYERIGSGSSFTKTPSRVLALCPLVCTVEGMTYRCQDDFLNGWTVSKWFDTFADALLGTSVPYVVSSYAFLGVVQHCDRQLLQLIAHASYHLIAPVTTCPLFVVKPEAPEERDIWECWKPKMTSCCIFNFVRCDRAIRDVRTAASIAGSSIEGFVDDGHRVGDLCQAILLGLSRFCGVQDYYDTICFVFEALATVGQRHALSLSPDFGQAGMRLIRSMIDDVLKPAHKRDRRRALSVCLVAIPLLHSVAVQLFSYRKRSYAARRSDLLKLSGGVDASFTAAAALHISLFQNFDYIVALTLTGSGTSSTSLVASSITGVSSGSFEEKRPTKQLLGLLPALPAFPFGRETGRKQSVDTIASGSFSSVAETQPRGQLNTFDSSHAIRFRVALFNAVQFLASLGGEGISLVRDRLNLWTVFLASNIYPFVTPCIVCPVVLPKVAGGSVHSSPARGISVGASLAGSTATMGITRKDIRFFASPFYLVQEALGALHAMFTVKLADYSQRQESFPAINALCDRIIEILTATSILSPSQLYCGFGLPRHPIREALIDLLSTNPDLYFTHFVQKLGESTLGTVQCAFYFEACVTAALAYPKIITEDHHHHEAERGASTEPGGSRRFLSVASAPTTTTRQSATSISEERAALPASRLVVENCQHGPLLVAASLCHVSWCTDLAPLAQRFLNACFRANPVARREGVAVPHVNPNVSLSASQNFSDIAAVEEAAAMPPERSVSDWCQTIVQHDCREALHQVRFFNRMFQVIARYLGHRDLSPAANAMLLTIVACTVPQLELSEEALDYMLLLTRRNAEDHPETMALLWQGLNRSSPTNLQRLCAALLFSWGLEDHLVVFPHILRHDGAGIPPENLLLPRAILIAAYAELRRRRHAQPSTGSSDDRQDGNLTELSSAKVRAYLPFALVTPSTLNHEPTVTAFSADQGRSDGLDFNRDPSLSDLYGLATFGHPTDALAYSASFLRRCAESSTAVFCLLAKCASIIAFLSPFVLNSTTPEGQECYFFLHGLFSSTTRKEFESETPEMMKGKPTFREPSLHSEANTANISPVRHRRESSDSEDTVRIIGDDDEGDDLEAEETRSVSEPSNGGTTDDPGNRHEVFLARAQRELCVIVLHVSSIVFGHALHVRSTSPRTATALSLVAGSVARRVLTHPAEFLAAFSGANDVSADVIHGIPLERLIAVPDSDADAVAVCTPNTMRSAENPLNAFVTLLAAGLPLTLCCSWLREALKWGVGDLPQLRNGHCSPSDAAHVEISLLSVHVLQFLATDVGAMFLQEMVSLRSQNESDRMILSMLQRQQLTLQVVMSPALTATLKAAASCALQLFRPSPGEKRNLLFPSFIASYASALAEMLHSNGVAVAQMGHLDGADQSQESPFLYAPYSEESMHALFWAAFSLVCTSELFGAGVAMAAAFYRTKTHRLFASTRGVRRVPRVELLSDSNLSELSAVGCERCMALLVVSQCGVCPMEGGSGFPVGTVCDFLVGYSTVDAVAGPFLAAAIAILVRSDKQLVKEALKAAHATEAALDESGGEFCFTAFLSAAMKDNGAALVVRELALACERHDSDTQCSGLVIIFFNCLMCCLQSPLCPPSRQLDIIAALAELVRQNTNVAVHQSFLIFQHRIVQFISTAPREIRASSDGTRWCAQVLSALTAMQCLYPNEDSQCYEGKGGDAVQLLSRLLGSHELLTQFMKLTIVDRETVADDRSSLSPSAAAFMGAGGRTYQVMMNDEKTKLNRTISATWSSVEHTMIPPSPVNLLYRHNVQSETDLTAPSPGDLLLHGSADRDGMATNSASDGVALFPFSVPFQYVYSVDESTGMRVMVDLQDLQVGEEPQSARCYHPSPRESPGAAFGTPIDSSRPPVNLPLSSSFSFADKPHWARAYCARGPGNTPASTSHTPPLAQPQGPPIPRSAAPGPRRRGSTEDSGNESVVYSPGKNSSEDTSTETEVTDDTDGTEESDIEAG